MSRLVDLKLDLDTLGGEIADAALKTIIAHRGGRVPGMHIADVAPEDLDALARELGNNIAQRVLVCDAPCPSCGGVSEGNTCCPPPKGWNESTCEFCDQPVVGPRGECGAVDDGICGGAAMFHDAKSHIRHLIEISALGDTVRSMTDVLEYVEDSAFFYDELGLMTDDDIAAVRAALDKWLAAGGHLATRPRRKVTP